MSKVIDLAGQKFGKLTVIKRHQSTKQGKATWLCKCDCGNEVIVQGILLRKGATKSCGCLMKEMAPFFHRTHGLEHSRLYNIWMHMKQRCLNKNNNAYKWYGKRGITVCGDWLADFMNFYNWAIANGYQDDLTIDRIDVNGNYEPSNCRWVNIETQQNNRRNNYKVTINNETHTLPEWAKIYNISVRTIRKRLARGWNDQEAIITKSKKEK